MNRSSKIHLASMLTLLALLLSVNAAQAQTTTFTYQGRFTDNQNGGNATNGTYDFQFKLFDGLSGGSQLGGTVDRSGVTVTNSTFTVQLDFGAGVFPGANRFLEIGVRQTGSGSFSTLNPRQPVTSTPYAIRSLSAATAETANTANTATTATTANNALQLNGQTASQFVLTGDSRLSDARTPTAGSGNYIQNTLNPQGSSNFNISGNGFIGGNAGIGTTTPGAKLEVNGNLLFSQGANRSIGVATNTTNNFGHSLTVAGGDAQQSGAQAVGGGNLFLNGGKGYGIDAFSQGGSVFITPGIGTGTVAAAGNTILGFDPATSTARGFVGIGTSTPGFPLDVQGPLHIRPSGSAPQLTGASGLLLGSVSGSYHWLQSYGNTPLILNPLANFVGIGTTTPGSRLTVAGVVESTSGGVKFPDGTVQTTAASGGGGNAIQNTTVQQANANFNISGNGTVGGTLTAGTLSVTGDTLLLRGKQALSNKGPSNVFAGEQAGAVSSLNTGGANSFFGAFSGSANTSGSLNTFIGVSAGGSNTTGDNLTLIGRSADVGSAGLTNATALGSKALVTASNSLVLGSIAGVNGATASTNVGIGTTAPVDRLTVRTATNEFGVTVTDGNVALSSIASNTVGALGTKSNHPLAFFTNNGNAQITLLPNGHVGIGTSNPARALTVVGSATRLTDGTVNVESQATGNDGWFGTTTNHDFHLLAGGFNIITVDKAGASMYPSADNLTSSGRATQRWSAVFAANGTIQTSDARLKKAVTNLGYGLSQVMQLRPVTFQWKDSNEGRTYLGLIAQEVEKVIPEAIERSKEADSPLGMSYTSLVPVLIKAVQEQQATLDHKEAEIKAIKAENEALNARLAALEQMMQQLTGQQSKQAPPKQQ